MTLRANQVQPGTEAEARALAVMSLATALDALLAGGPRTVYESWDGSRKQYESAASFAKRVRQAEYLLDDARFELEKALNNGRAKSPAPVDPYPPRYHTSYQAPP